MGALGHGAPFKQVLTHGWTVDGQGRAMHKSLGNGIDPADLIKEYGADIVRLWAGSADYHADVRCSKEIFKQLSQSYLKFRNTARYCLGNLNEFDPDNLVAPEDMEELGPVGADPSRRAGAGLPEGLRQLRVPCGVPRHQRFLRGGAVLLLSGHHQGPALLRGKDGLRRRSAQSALFLILDAMAKLFAPILAFTCDEIWQSMPHRASDDARNVLLNQMPEGLRPVRAGRRRHGKVGRGHEAASGRQRRAGAGAGRQARIGKALEAHVTLATEDAAIRPPARA